MAHGLVDALRDGAGEVVSDVDDAGPAAPVGGDLEGGESWVAVRESDNVGDVRAAPLIDGLLVVADHA